MADETPKLVLVGPVGAGKTTLLGSITGTPPISTEMPLTDGATADKTTTTVALDFSSVSLDDDVSLLVYGVPGQSHFSFMRPILLDGALGAILVLNGTDPELVSHCDYWLDEILGTHKDMPVVVGITHTDINPGFDLCRIRDRVRRRRASIPVFTLDVRRRDHSIHLVRALLTAAR